MAASFKIYPSMPSFVARNKPALRIFTRDFRFDNFAAWINIKLYTMCSMTSNNCSGKSICCSAGSVLASRTKPRRRISFIREFVDDSSIYFVLTEWLAGVLFVPFFGLRFYASSFSSGRAADRQYQMMAAWMNWMSFFRAWLSCRGVAIQAR